MFRWKLRSVMADKKVTAISLSEKLNFSRSAISEWMKSDEIPNFKQVHKTIGRICEALNCTILDLVEVSDD